MKIMVTSFKTSHACTATLSAPNPAGGHHRPTPPLETPGHSQASLGQSVALNMPTNLENLAVATGLEKVSFHSIPKKSNANECSNFRTIALISISQSVSSVAQSCPTLCDPMHHSTPGLPVHHQLPEFTQTHIHRVRDAIQPSHPLSSPSSPAPNPSQHQSLFQ